jgi:Mn-dependent DtxR family transcriptional regulator
MTKKPHKLHHFFDTVFQEYLEKILRFNINNGNKGVSNSELAKALNLTPSSVYEMIKKLEDENLIYKEEKKIFLTENGEKIALLIVSNNVSMKVFLSRVLGVNDEKVLETIACGLEHFIPIDVNKNLVEMLGMENINFKSREVLQANYYKFFDKMVIVSVKKIENLINDFKMKLADEIPGAWSAINETFNELENQILKNRE